MTVAQHALIIGVAAIATMLTRFLPFMIFRSDKPTPKFLLYLGRALPPAVFGMLVIYCLKNVSLLVFSFGIPEIIGVISVVVLHLVFRKMLVSIAGGTVIYMTLVNLIFV